MNPDALSLPLGPRQIDSLPLLIRDGFGAFDQVFPAPPHVTSRVVSGRLTRSI
jgi:hypothetical protein